MQISSIQSQVANYSLQESNQLGEETMKELLNADAEIKQQPIKQKMVANVNQAVQNGHVDIYG